MRAKMNKTKYLSIKVEVYEDMIFRYLKAMEHISDLELELFELQEELSAKYKKANTK